MLLQRMKHLFASIADENSSGSVTWAEFQHHTQHPDFQQFLKEIDLSNQHCKHLFYLLDPLETGDVAIEELVNGCSRLHGPAKALDVEMSMRRNNTHQDRIEKSLRELRDAFCAETRTERADS